MAAVSAPQASNSTSLTPPGSSHGGASAWNYSVPTQTENSKFKMADHHNRPPLSNGLSQKRSETFNSAHSVESGHLAPARINALAHKDSNLSDSGSAPDSLLDLYGSGRTGLSNGDLEERNGNIGAEEDPERSRWIHRDKLVKIEAKELQDAGFILPRTRAASKSSRRDRSRDKHGHESQNENHGGQKRQRIGSYPSDEPPANQSWDLRTPEEAAEADVGLGEFYRDVSGGVKGVSRIPVSKSSPIPIPTTHLERDTPIRRVQGGGYTGEDEAISYPKSRGRSNSIKLLDDAALTPTPAKRIAPSNSPTKTTVRKTSAPAGRTASAQRPKTRSGTNGTNRDVSGQQRPSTRSGELNKATEISRGGSISKRPEGDPPWLATMFKPDPRLPPDQQLLPTVAKRLQQEQWEKEGKFGTAYDTSFRPLNDAEFQQRPDNTVSTTLQVENEKTDDQGTEWPLRPPPPKSPALSVGRPGTSGGGYSTIPKIAIGKPQAIEPPLPSPMPAQLQPRQEPPKESKKEGCGCCAVM